jgi:hypothetical protein
MKQEQLKRLLVNYSYWAFGKPQEQLNELVPSSLALYCMCEGGSQMTRHRYCWFREEQKKNHRNRGMETVQEIVQKWRSGASEPTPVS